MMLAGSFLAERASIVVSLTSKHSDRGWLRQAEAGTLLQLMIPMVVNSWSLQIDVVSPDRYERLGRTSLGASYADIRQWQGTMDNEPYRVHVRQNREAWNRMAAPRRSLAKPPEFFASGGCTLEDFELDLMGPVQGKRMLHLQCASGNETLSWAGQGATVVGVDISEVAIDIARDQAHASGLNAEFVAADVYELPSHILSGSFDLVYSSWGVICWLPDIRQWAEVVAACLKPGGAFMLAEHHPLWEITVLTDHGFNVTHSYFGRNTPLVGVGDTSKAPSGTPLQDDRVNFVWPVGDVVTALIQAGLTIRYLEERPSREMYMSTMRDPGADAERTASWLPAVYVVLADKG